MIVAPSLLSADFARLAEDVHNVEQLGADWHHFDVMDGHFVPNLSFGPGIQKHLRKISKLFIDTHLMLTHPGKYIEPFVKCGSDLITFHAECEQSPEELIAQIKEAGVKVGMSVKPGTEVQVLEPWLDQLDLILIMTVEPGFGGQSFMESGLPKIQWLAQQKKEKGYNYFIEVDGGVDEVTGPKCAKAGAEVLVAGSSVYGAKDRAAIMKALKTADRDC